MAKIPKAKEAVMKKVRDLLAENFDVGVTLVSWEEGGETFHMHLKFGNEYAAKQLVCDAAEILWPPEEEDEEEDEDDDDGEAWKKSKA